MATYDYRCRECDRTFEIRHAMTATARTVQCPDGHDDVARVWSAVGMLAAGSSAASAPGAAAGGGCCGGGCCS